jgi:uncharacterized protein YceK
MRHHPLTIVSAALVLAGCSTVMEADRPSAVNLGNYHAGLKRIEVVEKLGAPISVVNDGGNSCDIYKLYTHGTSTAAKVGIITGEAAADIFTLGLFEAIATPAQAASKAHIHTVLFCYSGDEQLVSVVDQGHKLPTDLPSVSTDHPAATTVQASVPASPPPPAPQPSTPTQQAALSPSVPAPAPSSQKQPVTGKCRPTGLSVQGDTGALHQSC